jgi:hypothetical protein
MNRAKNIKIRAYSAKTEHPNVNRVNKSTSAAEPTQQTC